MGVGADGTRAEHYSLSLRHRCLVQGDPRVLTGRKFSVPQQRVLQMFHSFETQANPHLISI